MYFAYVDHALHRVNTFTGVAYKDDPTIMIWEIMNEPRFGPWQTTSAAADVVARWLDDAAKHIKSIDPRHLLSTGEEGFLRSAGSRSYPWRGAEGEGSDFEQHAALASIDVLSIHAWPFQWSLFDEYGPGNPSGRTYADFTPEWIDAHLAIAERVQKPLYLGEFGWQILRREGSSVSDRDVILSRAFTHAPGTSIAGVAYWHSTPRHDVLAATYFGPIIRPDVQQAIYSDNVIPHDLAFRFDVFCPEDRTTCGLIGDFSAKMSARVERPDPAYPCVGPELFCRGACIDLGSDVASCGVCGRACAAGESCAGGVCYVPGGAPLADAGAASASRPSASAPPAYAPCEPSGRVGDCAVSAAGAPRAPGMFAITATLALVASRRRRAPRARR